MIYVQTCTEIASKVQSSQGVSSLNDVTLLNQYPPGSPLSSQLFGEIPKKSVETTKKFRPDLLVKIKEDKKTR